MMAAIGNTRIFRVGRFKTDTARFLVESAHGFVRLCVLANASMAARANGNMRIERFVVVVSPGIFFFLGIAIDDTLVEFGFHQIGELERKVQFGKVHGAGVFVFGFGFGIRRTRRSQVTVVLHALGVFTEEGAAKMIAGLTHLFHET